MLKISLGEMLRRFRIEKGFEATQVCDGLCSNTLMTHFEQGKKFPDPLLFEYMMERMGVSAELFSIMVSQEEYAYYRWKERVFEAISKRDCIRLEHLLESRIIKRKYLNSKLERQFQLYATAIYCGMNGKYVEATQMLEKATYQTIPNMSQIKHAKVLLSSLELHIIILHLYYGVLGECIDIKTGKKLFFILEEYISNEKLDLFLRAKIYPKLCCIGLILFKEVMTEKERKALCEMSMQLMIKDMSFHEITNVLRFYIPLLEKNEREKANFYRKQYEVFEDILKTENIETEFYAENLSIVSPKIYIVNEYLLYKRQVKDLTQEQLSEGICEPETYSRVETGKRSPSKRNFRKLAERLDISWCFYRGELDTTNLSAFDLRVKQREANINYKSQESLEILNQLEKQLDMSSVINIQYVRSNECIAKYRLGQISGDEAVKNLNELLELTTMINASPSQLVYYSQTELEIMAHLAQILRNTEQYEKAIKYIKNVINQVQGSKVNMKYQWGGFGFLLRVLESLYFKIQKYEIAIRITKYVQNENVRRRNASNIVETLDEMADCYEHMGERYKEECKKLYRYTYYVADFYKLHYAKTYIKKYYEDKFDPEIKWY